MTNSLKIVYAGTPAFAATILEALLNSSHQVIAVYTHPDTKTGRGLKLTQNPVKTLAMQHQLPIYQPKTLKDSNEEDVLRSLNADVMVVAAYGLLLPAWVLHMMPLGCINVHPSLLPRWRGAAPIQRTLFAGDTISGVTIMQMDAGLDTGPILLQRQYVLEPDETAQTLDHRLAILGADALIEALDLLAQGKLSSRPQDDHAATYAHKICKEEALLDWTRPAIDLEYEVRAFNPWPVAYTNWREMHLRIWQAKAITQCHHLSPRILISASSEGIDITTGAGVLRLLQVQLPGGKVISARDFYNARRDELVIGERFI